MFPFSKLESYLHLPSKEEPIFVKEYPDYQVVIKREDQIDPYISGNKWRKLKYNLKYFVSSDHDGILTVGGPFSNHIVAVARACQILDIPCTGLIRGKSIDDNNPTLNLCKQFSMILRPITKDEFAKRGDFAFVQRHSPYFRPFFIPEGGSNEFHSLGCQEIMNELSFNPNYIVLPIGTGGTASAISKVSRTAKIIAISPFKKDKVLIPFLSEISLPHEVNYKYSLKGYGRFDRVLVDYINQFWDGNRIPLDPIYNAKGMMGLEDLLANNYFEKGSKILYVHTGGSQGIAGFNRIHGQKAEIKIPHSIYFPEVAL